MWNVCPRCNHLNSDDSKRCELCGFKLTAPQPSVDHKRTYEQPQARVVEVSRPRHSYLDDWFGPRVSFEQRRRNVTVVAIAAVILLLASAYGASGHYCNTLLWVTFGGALAWVTFRLGKERWSDAKTLAVGLFVIFPLFVAAFIPWDDILDGRPGSPRPVFVDDLHYYTVYVVEDGSRQIVVDGFIMNEGTGGGSATVRITAYSGYDGNDTSEFGNIFREGYVSTGWIDPGLSFHLHWECNLSHFDADGIVTWQILDDSAQ